MAYQWDFATVGGEWRLLLPGLRQTLGLTASALLLAIPLGLLFTVLRLSPFVVLRWISQGISDLLRTSALYVLIIWFFFAFPVLFSVRLDAFEAATLAIGLQTGAYFGELCRAGLNSVPQGQWEGARSLGFPRATLLRYIIVPQAVRVVLPVLLSLLVEVVKGTSLAAAIACEELTYQASAISSATYRPIETFSIVAALYFAILFPASRLFGFLERRGARRSA